MSDGRRDRADRRLRLWVALGVPFVRLLAATWRVREVGREGWNARRAAGEATILALWHGQLLALTPHHGGGDVSVLISEHRDGEIIARVVRAFGYRAVRGSTSRGGGRALLELVALLRRREEVAVTPDGPRGPRHAFAPGVLIAAQRSGVPVVGVVAHVSRAWRLSSWDRFEIPKPYARITISYSEPLAVDASTPREAAALAPTFERMMADLAERAAASARRA